MKWSIPSKVFVLGEYAVLNGAPALLATIPPRFELALPDESVKNPQRSFRSLSPDAPVRRLLQSRQNTHLLECSFTDPHEGSGGFGGSTAEFALAFAALGPDQLDVSSVWNEYCRIQPQASGADLAAQWVGGAVIADPASKTVEKIQMNGLLKNWFVFSAAHQPGRKVKTHEHLDALSRANLSRLTKGSALGKGIRSARSGDFSNFADAVNEYADQLQSMGFELSQTSEDRDAFRIISGVRAVKGTGAMQADAVLVICDPEEDLSVVRSRILEVSEKRNLRLVASGWHEEAGINRVSS